MRGGPQLSSPPFLSKIGTFHGDSYEESSLVSREKNRFSWSCKSSFTSKSFWEFLPLGYNLVLKESHLGYGYDCEKERFREFTLLSTAGRECFSRRLGSHQSSPSTHAKKWLFDLKNWGKFLLQKIWKVWVIDKPQDYKIYCNTRQAKLLRWYLRRNCLSWALKWPSFLIFYNKKESPIFQIK